jgi:hypothetical protein
VRAVPAERRSIAVLLAVLVASAIAAVVVHADDSGPEHVLGGETEQGRQVEMELDERGRALAFATSVEAVCKGGHRWSIDWAPRDGDAVFRQRDDRLAVREVVERADRPGRIARIGALMTAQVTKDFAGGELRLVGRFYRGGREVQACDSGPVRWAAGIDAESRLANALPARPPTGWYYPKVPSLATTVSPARSRFIRATDRTCARTFPAAKAAAEAIVAAAGDPERELTAYAAYVEAHAAQLRALERLGVPPDGADLHRRWIANMRTRVRLERAGLRYAVARDRERVQATNGRIGELMLLGNEIGQRFGLQVCTSNGPDRTPVPH